METPDESQQPTSPRPRTGLDLPLPTIYWIRSMTVEITQIRYMYVHVTFEASKQRSPFVRFEFASDPASHGLQVIVQNPEVIKILAVPAI